MKISTKKSILAIAIIASLALTACSESPIDSNLPGDLEQIVTNAATTKETREGEEPPTQAPRENREIPEEFNDTKTFASFELVNGDTYSFVMKIPGVGGEIKVARKGYNFCSSMMGIETLIVDGKSYALDADKETAEFKEVTEWEIIDIMAKYEGLDRTMIDLEGASLLGTGTEEFKGEERYYEEILDKAGTISKVFFDDNDDMLGMTQPNAEGKLLEITFSITGDVPDAMFDIPEGYKQIEGN